MSVYALPQHEFIEFSGPDTRGFLQGQVSCNVDLLSETRSLAGAICNLKGRVVADFRLLQTGDNCLMQTGRGMADKILSTLSRYAVFSKVELRRLELPLAVGIVGAEYGAALARLFQHPPAAVNDCAVSSQMCLLRLPGNRCELWCMDRSVIPPLRELLGEWPPEPGRDWLAAGIAAGELRLSPAMSEKFTPQLLNYDISGVINFSKGCYTGQEIVARMHFRGKPKKRMFLFESDRAFEENSVICPKPAAGGKGGEALLAHVNHSREVNLALAAASIERAETGAPFFLDGRQDQAVFAIPLDYSNH